MLDSFKLEIIMNNPDLYIKFNKHLHKLEEMEQLKEKENENLIEIDKNKKLHDNFKDEELLIENFYLEEQLESIDFTFFTIAEELVHIEKLLTKNEVDLYKIDKLSFEDMKSLLVERFKDVR